MDPYRHRAPRVIDAGSTAVRTGITWLEFPPLILETTDHQLESIGFFFPPWIYLWSGAPSPIVFQDPLADADREMKRERDREREGQWVVLVVEDRAGGAVGPLVLFARVGVVADHKAWPKSLTGARHRLGFAPHRGPAPSQHRHMYGRFCRLRWLILEV